MALSSIIQVLTPDRSVLGYAPEADSTVGDLKSYIRECLDLKETTKIKIFYSGNKLSKKMLLIDVWIYPGWCLIAEIGGKKLPTALNYLFQIEETGETVIMEITDKRLIRDIKMDLVQSVEGVNPGCFFIYRGQEIQDLVAINNIGILEDIPIIVTRLNPDPRRMCSFTFKTPKSQIPRVAFSAKTPIDEVTKALFPGERVSVRFFYGNIQLDNTGQIGDWQVQDGETISIEIAGKLPDGDSKKGIKRLLGTVRKGLTAQNRASSSRRIYSPCPPVTTHGHEEPTAKPVKDVFQMFDAPMYTDEDPAPALTPVPTPTLKRVQEVKPMVIEKHDEEDCHGLVTEKFVFRGFRFQYMFPEEHSEDDMREAVAKLIGLDVRINKLVNGEYMVLSDSEEQPLVFCFMREGKRPIVLVYNSAERVGVVKARLCEILDTSSAFISLRYINSVIEDYKRLTEVYKEGITIEEQVVTVTFKIMDDPIFATDRLPVVIKRPVTILELKNVLAERLNTLPKAMEVINDEKVMSDLDVVRGQRVFTLKSLAVTEKKAPLVMSGSHETCTLKCCINDTVGSITDEIAEMYHVKQRKCVVLLDNNIPIRNESLFIRNLRNLSIMIKQTLKGFTYGERTVEIAVDEDTTVGDVIPELSCAFRIPETKIDINGLEESDVPPDGSEVSVSDTCRFVVCDGDSRICFTSDSLPTCKSAKKLIAEKLGLESNAIELENTHKKLIMPWENIPRTVVMLRLEPADNTHVNIRVGRKEPVQVEINDETTVSQLIGVLHKLGRKVDALIYRGLILTISEKVSNLGLGPRDFLVGFEVVR